MHPAAFAPTPLSPFERRQEWHAAALLAALVLAPEALQVVVAELGHDRAPDPGEVPVRSRRVGRRPGVRPPRSC